MYLELKASSQWRREFVRQNYLVCWKEAGRDPPDAPLWFIPDKNSLVFTQHGDNNLSIYYDDTTKGQMFIYEIQQ